MTRRFVPLLLACSAASTLAGCVVARNSSGALLAPDREAAIAGRVVAIDTAPWAYDGNAIVQVATQAHGIVQVHLPARWNLCAAPPVAVDALAIGDDVTASGTAADGNVLVVCTQATHHLREVD